MPVQRALPHSLGTPSTSPADGIYKWEPLRSNYVPVLDKVAGRRNVTYAHGPA